MSKHDEARRAFLVGAAVGAGAAAGAALIPDALAQTPQAQPAAATPPAHAHPPSQGYGAWLNVDESATIQAFTERLMPGAPGKPGATDAGVLNYIDLALAGAYADQRDFYRRGLAQLDAYCRKAHNEAFANLTAAPRDKGRSAGCSPCLPGPANDALWDAHRGPPAGGSRAHVAPAAANPWTGS